MLLIINALYFIITFCIGNYYTNAKSIRELELHYRPLAEAIDEAVAWFRLHGMLPK